MEQTKSLYLITTKGCVACDIMYRILQAFERERIKKDKCDFTLNVKDLSNIPDFIKNTININDFPATIFVKENGSMYHFVGTKPIEYINELTKRINF